MSFLCQHVQKPMVLLLDEIDALAYETCFEMKENRDRNVPIREE